MTLQDYLKDFQVEGVFSSTDLQFCTCNRLLGKLDKIDFDVYLPSYGKNLQREYVWNNIQQR